MNEETKQKISQAMIGNQNGLGHPCSEEKKQILKEKSHKKSVYCEELDKIFESVQECSRQLGIPATNISKLCNGRGKTLKGYHLRYYNDTINA